MSLEACEYNRVIINSEFLSSENLLHLLERIPSKFSLTAIYLNMRNDTFIWILSAEGILRANTVAMGHKNIAMVTGPDSLFEVRERSAGFIEALRRYRVTIRACNPN